MPAREAEPANGNAAELVHVSSGARHVVWARLLWERRRFIRRSAIAGFLLFIVISLLITPTFESKARLMPVDQQMGSGLAAMAALVGRSGPGGGLGSALGGGLGGMASELLGIKNSGALLVDMLGGPTVQDEVIKKLDLMKVYHARYWQDARRRLGGQTELNDDRKSGVITITVTDRDRVRAQQIAQAYVEALNAALAKVFTSSARRERQFLEQRVKTVKENLDAAAQQFSQFQSKNVTLDLPSQSRAMLESEASLEGQLIAAQSELEGLEQIYTDNNLRVRTLRGKIGSLRHQIETMSGREGVDGGAGETAIPGDLPSIRKLPLVGVQWASLYRESKIQETVYELLTEEYEFAKVQEAKEIPTVNVLDAPLVPEKKSSPKRTLIVIFGTFLAFSLACAFIIGSDVWRQNQSPEKEFVSEVWSQIAPQNSRARFVAYHVWRKLSGPNGSSGNGTA
ncbi:MAG: lipopolysaccharide biosynthesis protein [Acidobacteria bacterium]|nr:lipopolysaccharide biosynthesis protein [Acidobacteriota bacterium]